MIFSMLANYPVTIYGRPTLLRLHIIFTFTLLILISVSPGVSADVLVEHAGVNTLFDGNGINTGYVSAGSGETGDLVLAVCGIDTEDNNPFNTPFPGVWTEINNSLCFGQGCQLGVWTGVTDTGGPEDITCSWEGHSAGFAAGSFRFGNVDTESPVIDFACSEATGDNIVVRPVSSEPGAQVMGIMVTVFTGPGLEEQAEFDEFEGLVVGPVDIGGGRTLQMAAQTGIDETGAGFPGMTEPLPEPGVSIAFCFLSVRMESVSVPALNRQALGVLAAAAGIAGLWVFRKRAFRR